MAKNILICDDAAFMRMMIKDILVKNGYNIAGEAENGVKEFTGVLKDYKDKTAFVELDGEVKEIPVKQAVYIRLSFKF